MDSLGDFIGQPPVQRFLLILIGLGILYIFLVAGIMRRSAARKRLAKEQAMATLSANAPRTTVSAFGGTRERRISSPVDSDLPEPDFHLLVAPDVVDTGAVSEGPIIVDLPADQPADSDYPIYEASAASSALIPAQEAAMTNTQPDNNAPSIHMGDAVEVMRVWRDLSDGSLIIEMGNQRYRSMAEIQSPELVRRFTAVIRELATMVGNIRTSADLPPAPSPAMGIMKPQAESPEPKSKGLFQMGRSNKQQTAGAAQQPSGIANAVEEFLQFKLSTTPQFSMRSIHINPGRDQSVIIEVDGRTYDAIGDVEDPEVREFLSSMMQEWSARH